MRLGVLGGTFDPIHNAHLFIAEEARVAQSLDRLIFIPNRIPPHKAGEQIAPPEHRLEMTRLAIRGNKHFGCSTLEIAREGPSYTVDTLRELSRQIPDAELFLVTGMDTVAEIETWHQPADILTLCKVLGISRPRFDTEKVLGELPEGYAKRVISLDTTLLEISSTEIRERVRNGRPIRYLTPDPVVEYIAEHGLYR